MNRKISVIIPCYNLEKEIGNCIESVLNQTFQNLEILVIDDGSKDSSVNVIKQYCKWDSRVSCIEQENQGPSAARNNGIQKATGDYIMFIDGDDTIGKTYIEELEKAIIDDCDLVIAGLRYVYSNGEESIVNGIAFHEEKADFIDKHYAEFIKRRLIFGPVNKLYKREVLEKYNIRFDTNIEIREDGLFVLDFIEKTKTISGIENSEYFYIQHSLSGSLVTKFHESETRINERFFKRLLELYNGKELKDEEIASIYPIYLNMDISSIRKFFKSESPGFNEGMKYIKKILKNPTFIEARRRLAIVNKKSALKYYRPASVVYLINMRAVKKMNKNN